MSPKLVRIVDGLGAGLAGAIMANWTNVVYVVAPFVVLLMVILWWDRDNDDDHDDNRRA